RERLGRHAARAHALVGGGLESAVTQAERTEGSGLEVVHGRSMPPRGRRASAARRLASVGRTTSTSTAVKLRTVTRARSVDPQLERASPCAGTLALRRPLRRCRRFPGPARACTTRGAAAAGRFAARLVATRTR